MNSIGINLVFEDVVSEAILDAILRQSRQSYTVQMRLGKNGFGYIKKRISNFNQAARMTPFLVLTDLDQSTCPVHLIQEWLPVPQHPNLIFRIAVREVESWVMADRSAFGNFFGISCEKIPQQLDDLQDPKQFLINLVRKSKKSEIKRAIVPDPGSTAKVGKDYNAPLLKFITQNWQAELAMEHSDSLRRTILAIQKFKPSSTF